MSSIIDNIKVKNNSSTKFNDTRTISEYLTDEVVLISAEAVPAEILQRCSLCFIDTIGVGLAAAGMDVGTAATKLVIKSSTGGNSSVWGTGKRASAVDAALANGMLAHALDFDDTHAAAIMHTSCMVVPATLALGQSLNISGRELLTAAVVGYEIAGLLGRLAPGNFQLNGFQATAILGVFAVAGAAARMLKLNRAQTINALGIAGSLAGGIMEYLANGSDVKQLHAGWSAQAGIRAAQMAVEGFTGPNTVFEGRFGVFRSFTRKDVDLETLINESESGWEVERMGPKPYPACLCVHPLVQAVLEIKAKITADGHTLDAIENLHCFVPNWYVNLVFEPQEVKKTPSTVYEARFSAPYCMAYTLINGFLNLESFSDNNIKDTTVADLASKVTYEIEELPEFPASFPAKVIASISGGEQYESYIHHNLGSPNNPLTPAQYKEKFHSITKKWVNKEQADDLLSDIETLDQATGLDDYTKSIDKIVVRS